MIDKLMVKFGYSVMYCSTDQQIVPYSFVKASKYPDTKIDTYCSPNQ